MPTDTKHGKDSKNGTGPAMPKRPLPKNRLRELRTKGQKKGTLWLTVDEVAAVLGITKDHVSRHETLQRGISDEHLAAYARLYKVEPWHIFTGLTTDTTPRRR